jgi:hypothetical protein
MPILRDIRVFVKRGEGMEQAAVKRWLDELVADFNASTQNRVLSPSIYASINSDMWILVHEGIDIIADVMNLKLSEEIMNNDTSVWFVYSFKYQGVKFVTYRKTRLTGYGE